MLCLISHTHKKTQHLTELGICHSAEISKNILPEKLPLNLTGVGEVVHAFLSLGAPSKSHSNAVLVILASHFTLGLWWAEFSVELTVNFQMKQLLIGIHQLVQTECFRLWQPPSSMQTGMSYKTACGVLHQVFGKEVMDFLGCLWHLRSCFIPFWTETRIRNTHFSETNVSDFPFHLQFYCLHLIPHPNIPTKVFQQHRNVKYHLLWPGYSEEEEGYTEARNSTERSVAAAYSRVFTQRYLAAEVVHWLDSFFHVGPAQLSLWVLLQEKLFNASHLWLAVLSIT